MKSILAIILFGAAYGKEVTQELDPSNEEPNQATKVPSACETAAIEAKQAINAHYVNKAETVISKITDSDENAAATSKLEEERDAALGAIDKTIAECEETAFANNLIATVFALTATAALMF